MQNNEKCIENRRICCRPYTSLLLKAEHLSVFPPTIVCQGDVANTKGIYLFNESGNCYNMFLMVNC